MLYLDCDTNSILNPLGNSFYFGKNAFSIFAFLDGCIGFVSQQTGLRIFQCVASAAHFLFLNGGKQNGNLGISLHCYIACIMVFYRERVHAYCRIERILGEKIFLVDIPLRVHRRSYGFGIAKQFRS